MLRFLADENFNGIVVRGLIRRRPKFDIVRVRDVGMAGAEDPAILEWAAAHERVILTHDAATFANHAYARVNAGMSMPGVLELHERLPVGVAIEEILIVAECSLEGECNDRVIHLPL